MTELKIKYPVNSKYGHFMSALPNLKGFIFEFCKCPLGKSIRAIGKIEMEDNHFSLPLNYLDGVEYLTSNDINSMDEYNIKYLKNQDNPFIPIIHKENWCKCESEVYVKPKSPVKIEGSKVDKMKLLKQKCIVEMDVHEFMKTSEDIIIKINDKFRGFKRSSLLDKLSKNQKIDSGEIISKDEISYIKDNNYSFYEILNTGDNTYCLVPYSTDTFINKYKF
jgi:hypothetical protein